MTQGFLPKDAPAAQLAAVIRRLARGERVLDPVLVAAVLETGAKPPHRAGDRRPAQRLRGLSTEQIGSQLFLSPATVRNHLS